MLAVLIFALVGLASSAKFIQLWGNSTCEAISVDWLPCV